MNTLSPKARALLELAKATPVAEVPAEKRELIKRAIIASSVAPLLIRPIESGASTGAGATAVAAKGAVLTKLAVGAKLAVAVLVTGSVGTSVWVATRSTGSEVAAPAAEVQREVEPSLEARLLSDVSIDSPAFEIEPSQSPQLAVLPAARSRLRVKAPPAERSQATLPPIQPAEETASRPSAHIPRPSVGPRVAFEEEPRHGAQTPIKQVMPSPDVPLVRSAPSGHSSVFQKPVRQPSLHGREIELLLNATRHLDDRSYAPALRVALEYQSQWPSGELLTESLVVQTLALCGLGRVSEAEAAAEKISETDRLNPSVRRLRQSCVGQKLQKEKEKPTD